MVSLNLERVIDAVFDIWHELPELLKEQWGLFETDLFELLKTEVNSENDDEVAGRVLRHFRRYENALLLLDSKYQELSFETESADYEAIPIYFATPCYYDDSQELNQQFTGRRGDGSLSYGSATVTIPSDHRMGNIERPPLWKPESSNKDINIYSLTKLSRLEFSAQANGIFREGQQRTGMVFVHGYRVTFKAALLRTAQLTYDLNFTGLPLLFSWPSTGRLLNYSADEDTVKWSQQHRHFQSFLDYCFNALNLNTIHVIAHSMGNRILTEALTCMTNARIKNKLGQVIFAAPDVSSDIFKIRSASFPSNADRYTLYTSKHDLAVGLSSFLHGGYPRAGKIDDDNVVIVPPIETIDASHRRNNFVGHSYFGDNKSIVSDMFLLLKHNHGPDDRPGLRDKVLQHGKMWFFHKANSDWFDR